MSSTHGPNNFRNSCAWIRTLGFIWGWRDFLLLLLLIPSTCWEVEQSWSMKSIKPTKYQSIALLWILNNSWEKHWLRNFASKTASPAVAEIEKHKTNSILTFFWASEMFFTARLWNYNQTGFPQGQALPPFGEGVYSEFEIIRRIFVSRLNLGILSVLHLFDESSLFRLWQVDWMIVNKGNIRRSAGFSFNTTRLQSTDFSSLFLSNVFPYRW